MKAFILETHGRKVQVEAKMKIICGIKCLIHKKLLLYDGTPMFSSFEISVSDAYSGAKIADGESEAEAIKYATKNIKNTKGSWKKFVTEFLKTRMHKPANPKFKITKVAA